MSNRKKIKWNFVSSLCSQIILIAMGLVIPRITMVGYGSEVNGLLTSVLQFIGYLTLFEAGIQAVATKALYQAMGANGDNKSEINSILAAVHINYKKTGMLYFGGLFVLSVVYPFIARCTSLDYFTVFFVVFFSGLGNVVLFFFQGKYKILLSAQGKGYLFTNVNTIISILNHVLKIILLLMECNVALVVASSFVVSLGQAVYIYLYMWKSKEYDWLDLTVTPQNEALQQNKQALIHQISYLIFSNTDVILLTLFCNLKVVSVYTIYKFVVTNLATFLIIPLNSSEFALGQLYHKDKVLFKKRIDTMEVFFSSLVFAVFAVVLYLYVPFLSLYTASVTDINYLDYSIAILFVVVELLTFMRYPMLRVISFAGHFKETLLRTIIETIINLVVSCVGVFLFGIRGVLAGTVVALLYRTFDIIVYSNKRLLARSPKKTISIYAINILIFVLITVCSHLVNPVIENYVDFFIIGVIATIVSIVVFFVVNLLLHKQERCIAFEILRQRKS